MRRIRAATGMLFGIIALFGTVAEAQPAPTSTGSCSDVLLLAGRNLMTDYNRTFLDRASERYQLNLTESQKERVEQMSGGVSYGGVGVSGGRASSDAQQYRRLQEVAMSDRELRAEEAEQFRDLVDGRAIAAWNRCIELHRRNIIFAVNAQADSTVIVTLGDSPSGGLRLGGVHVSPAGAFVCTYTQTGGAGATAPNTVADETTQLDLQGRVYIFKCERRSGSQTLITFATNDPSATVSVPMPRIVPAHEQESSEAIAALIRLANAQSDELRRQPVDQVIVQKQPGTGHLYFPGQPRGQQVELSGWANSMVSVAGASPDSTLGIRMADQTFTLQMGAYCSFTYTPDGRRYRIHLAEIDNRELWARVALYRDYGAAADQPVVCDPRRIPTR
jgi:hypothetical protein